MEAYTMNDLPMELWEEEDLLREFHAAGILLPEEKVEIERRREAAEVSRRLSERIGAMMRDQSMQQQVNPFQQAMQPGAGQQQMQQRTLGGLFGGALGGVFGGL
jgi:Mn-dependent DtxR family transcriptional regulator